MCVCESILSRLGEQIRPTSPLMLSGNFSRGTAIPSSIPTPAQKWCSAFVANPCFLNRLRPLGESRTQTSMRNALTKWTTNSQHGYRNADNVSLLFFHLFSPVSIRWYYCICHCLSFCLGHFPAVLCECAEVSLGCWWGKKKEILAWQHFILSFTPSQTMPHLCLSSPSFCLLLLLLPFLLLFFIKTSAALWPPPMRWGQRCSRLKKNFANWIHTWWNKQICMCLSAWDGVASSRLRTVPPLNGVMRSTN